MSGHPGELLSAFLDGELSASERAEVQGHLRECSPCARALEELAAVDAFARELPVTAPAGYFEELPGRVRARVRRPARVPRLAVWAAVAAAAVMAVVVTPVMLQRERSVVAPAEQAAPVAAPTAAVPPSTVAALTSGFADTAAAGGRALAAPQEKREERGRLQERDRIAKQALPSPAVLPEARPRLADAPRRKVTADAMDPAVRRDAPPATALPAAPAGPSQDRVAPPAAPAPARVSAQAQNVDGLAATRQEGARAEEVADAQKERSARPPERKLAAGGGAFAHPDDRVLMTDKRYQALLGRQATSAVQARALRDAWELFARDVPADGHADEARVRAIEAGVLAWKLGHDPADLATARARGRAYLETENVHQAARVRAALDGLP